MNKNIVVTGVTRGIGRQIAIDLSNKGYTVLGLYRNSDDLATSLERDYANIKTYKCNVALVNEVDTVAKDIIKNYGDIYGIVNNAGVSKTALFTETSETDFDELFEVNVKGVYAVTKAFLPNMINNKCGKIVNISSIWGVCGGSCEVVYSATKSAIIGLTKALAKELGPSNINVNCVAPGVIKTEMLNNLTETDLKCLADETSLMRIGRAEDISGVVEFLLNEKSSFITGQVITVDGGII